MSQKKVFWKSGKLSRSKIGQKYVNIRFFSNGNLFFTYFWPIFDLLSGFLDLTFPEGPGIEKIHSRSNAWKNHSPTHEIFILAWNFQSQFEIFILDWKFQSQALCFCGQRGARNEIFILDWKFYSVLKAWFFQYCLSRLNFFDPGALWVLFSPIPIVSGFWGF